MRTQPNRRTNSTKPIRLESNRTAIPLTGIETQTHICIKTAHPRVNHINRQAYSRKSRQTSKQIGKAGRRAGKQADRQSATQAGTQ